MKSASVTRWLGILVAVLALYVVSIGPVLQLTQTFKVSTSTVAALRGFYTPVFTIARSCNVALYSYENYTAFWAKVFRHDFEKSHTVIRDKPIFSSDGNYQVLVVRHGADHSPYSSRTKKRVELYLARQNEFQTFTFSRRDYTFVAAELQSSVEWSGPHLNIVLFDNSDGDSSEAADKIGTRSNHVATLRFVQVSKTSSYTMADVRDAGPGGFRQEK